MKAVSVGKENYRLSNMGAEDFIILIKDVSSLPEYFYLRFQKHNWYISPDARMTGFVLDMIESIVQRISFSG